MPHNAKLKWTSIYVSSPLNLFIKLFLVWKTCYILICRVMLKESQRHNDKGRAKTSLEKICTSHFIVRIRKGLIRVLLWEGVGDRTKTAIYWPPVLWPSVLCLSHSPGLLYYHLSPTSLVPNSSDFLSSPSYIIVQSPTQSLEWHVWSSSSGNNCHEVQRSLSSGASVYECIMGFYLVPFRQPNPPTRFLSITGHWNVSLPSGASPWNCMFGRVEGQYITQWPQVPYSTYSSLVITHHSK